MGTSNAVTALRAAETIVRDVCFRVVKMLCFAGVARARRVSWVAGAKQCPQPCAFRPPPSKFTTVMTKVACVVAKVASDSDPMAPWIMISRMSMAGAGVKS